MGHGPSSSYSRSCSRVCNFIEPPQEIISELSTQEKNEVSQIVITINDYLEKASDPTKNSGSRSWTICRVPFKLKRVHAQGFDPNIISIGPFHRHKLHLKAMDEHKLRFLTRLLNRMNSRHGDQNQNCTSSIEAVTQLESAVSSQQQQHEAAPVITTTMKNSNKIHNIECLAVGMKQLEASARACYSETFDHDQFSPNEFVMMMLLDGCFVVELLCLYVEWESDKADDPIFNTRWMVVNLKHDLLMLENQLPFPVLEKIFEITSSGNEHFSLTDLTLKFFNSLLPREHIFLDRCKLDSQPSHLLGLFRSSFQIQKAHHQKTLQYPQTKGWFSGRDTTVGCLRTWRALLPLGGILANKKEDSPPQDPSSLVIDDISNVSPFPIQERQLLIHCVTELKEAGIGFKKRQTHDLLDIKFKNGNLHIPPLFIDDYTGLVFLNFVAYEQCNPSTEPYITNYLLFFHSLLNSSKDVEHLNYKGIIDHVLGCDEDVAHLFHKLCREVIHNLDDCYLSKLLKDVSRYFRTKRHRWTAKWKHDYFSSPWAFFSFLAAVFVLILTAIQTFMAVFSYVTKPF